MRYDLHGKTALVTGATSGIGFETAKGLAQLGARVIVHGRCLERARTAATALPQLTDESTKHLYIEADFNSFQKVHKLAEQTISLTDHLDILINNAGTWTPKKILSEDGLERQFQVNHLSPFLLTHLLQEHILQSGDGRVINVASAMHMRGTVNFEDPCFRHRRYNGLSAYAQSKLAVVSASKSWSEVFSPNQCTVNAIHPGIVRTNIARGANIQGLIFRAFGLFHLTPREGAATSVFLAAEPEMATKTGRYYHRYEQARTHPCVMDAKHRARLWRLSRKLTLID